jgi:hypothetical protein
MMMYYVHPNGEVETGASGRQDQFSGRIFWKHYYLPYKNGCNPRYRQTGVLGNGKPDRKKQCLKNY